MRTDRIPQRVFIGIDNGVSGSVGVIKQSETSRETYFFKTPVFKAQDYTKKKKNVTRVDVLTFRGIFREILKGVAKTDVFTILERPMTNLGRLNAMISAARANEATLIVLESIGTPFVFVDSREWQKVLLPKEAEKEQLKTASRDIACRMFPEHKELITKHKDGDGMLMAEHCRRTYR